MSQYKKQGTNFEDPVPKKSISSVFKKNSKAPNKKVSFVHDLKDESSMDDTMHASDIKDEVLKNIDIAVLLK